MRKQDVKQPALPARLVIEVTQEDIDTGTRLNPETCPIGLAARRALPGYRRYSVGWSFIHISVDMSPATLYGGTRATRQFINRFDLGQPVQPHRFIVKKVDNLIDDKG